MNLCIALETVPIVIADVRCNIGINQMFNFLLIVLLTSLLVHFLVKKYILSVFISASLASICYQILGFWELGYVDAFWPISLIVTFFLSSLVSALAGMPFFIIRGKRRKNEAVEKATEEDLSILYEKNDKVQDEETNHQPNHNDIP